MEYKAENRIEIDRYNDLLNKYGVSGDEHFFRNLAIKIITDIPFNNLESVFHFEKIDPFSIENKELLNDELSSEYKKGAILLLQNRNIILFRAKLVF